MTPRPALSDQFGRIKRKLRVSITDRCNLRCPYCMPEHPTWLPKPQLLTLDEQLRLIRLFVESLGMTQIRITGGEPLLRPDLERFISALHELRGLGLHRISLTTNALGLAERAASIQHAGLDDLNVSLDTLDPKHFLQLSGGRGQLSQVLHGIEAAQRVGLPLKLNCVVVRDYNDADVLPLTQWAIERHLPIRFIEFMPLDGRGAWSADRVVSEADLLAQLRTQFRVDAVPRNADPASTYLLDGRHPIGIISTISRPFCAQCDRLRLTATGELFACLFASQGSDLRTPLRAGMNDAYLLDLIRQRVWSKGAGYVAQPGYVTRPLSMHALGG